MTSDCMQEVVRILTGNNIHHTFFDFFRFVYPSFALQPLFHFHMLSLQATR